MDMIVAIFKQLGADVTVFTQFAIFAVSFFIIKSLLFDRLQLVIELRESKTTGLDTEANNKLQEADNLAKKLKESLAEVYSVVALSSSEKKSEISKQEADKVRSYTAECEKETQGRRESFVKELDESKTTVMAASESLATDLLKKLS